MVLASILGTTYTQNIFTQNMGGGGACPKLLGSDTCAQLHTHLHTHARTHVHAYTHILLTEFEQATKIFAFGKC